MQFDCWVNCQKLPLCIVHLGKTTLCIAHAFKLHYLLTTLLNYPYVLSTCETTTLMYCPCFLKLPLCIAGLSKCLDHNIGVIGQPRHVEPEIGNMGETVPWATVVSEGVES